MPQQKQSTWKGACAGLVAGVAASWIMSKFQSALSSGQEQQNQDEPANVRAAEEIAESTGHEVAESQKQAAGTAVHYATGAIGGAIYGAVAQSVPLAAPINGALFGTVMWLIADEVAVPALGLSRRPSEYAAKTHVNALAAHLVYGVATALLAREILEASEARPATIRKAAITGAISGLRSMTGSFFGSRTAAKGSSASSVLHKFGSPTAAKVLGLLAAGELVADKLPQMPDRIQPASLAVRAATGALSGAAIFATEEGDPVAGALIGGAAAIGSSFGGYYLRQAAVHKGIPDFAYALGEDALAIAAGRVR